MFCVGIDIGSFSIKVAEIDASGKSFKITRVDEYLLSQDPAKDRKIEIIEVLREISQKYDPQNTKFVMGVDETQVSLRHINFPFKERHKIIKSLPFELEDKIPLDIDETVFDAKLSRYVGKTTDTFAVACPKVHIEETLNVAKDGLITPSIVSVKSISLASLFETWRDAPVEESADTDFDIENDETETRTQVTEVQKASIYINIGHSQTQVLVVKDGYLLDTRTIDFGGALVAKNISTKFNIHYIDAIKELRKKSFVLLNNEGASGEQVKLSNTIKESFENFFKDLRITVLALKGEHNLKFEEVFLCGGVSGIKNLGALFTQNLELPVNKLKNLPLLPTINLETSENNEIATLTAIGLALEGVKRPKNPPIDLLKDEFAIQNKSFAHFMQKWGTTMRAVAALFLILTIYGAVRESLTTEMTRESRNVLKTQGKKITGSGVRGLERNIGKYIKKQMNKEKMAKSFENVSRVNSALDLLLDISQSRPDMKGKIQVHYFDVLGKSVVIRGSASSSAAEKAFFSALKNLAPKSKVNSKNSTERVQKGWKGFEFNFNLPRMKDGDSE